MCNFQGTALGAPVSFKTELTCDSCGYTAYQPVLGVYRGHIYLQRYGQCDLIERSPFTTCPECHKTHYNVVAVCGGGSLFDAVLNQSMVISNV